MEFQSGKYYLTLEVNNEVKTMHANFHMHEGAIYLNANTPDEVATHMEQIDGTPPEFFFKYAAPTRKAALTLFTQNVIAQVKELHNTIDALLKLRTDAFLQSLEAKD